MTQGWVVDASTDKITFYESVPSTSTVVVNQYASGSINATAIWALGAWNGEYGFPSVVEFYSDRLGFAATIDQPQTTWFSRVGDYTMLGRSTPIADDDAFTATMNARQLNKIQALIPKQDLLVLTTGGVWKLGANGDALTPTTVTAKPQPSVGAGSLQPLDVGETAIYLSHMGWQVRDLAYTFESDGYAGSDLTAFASHLVKGKPITNWTWCPEPWSAVFACRDDGVLLTLTYKREHQVVAWARNDLSAPLRQCEAIPEDGAYGAYFCVERVVNGVTLQYIERMSDQNFDDSREEIGLDCALTYDGRNKTATTLALTGGATPGAETVITASSAIFSASNVGDQIVLDYDGTPCRIIILSVDSTTVARGIAARALTAADLTPGTSWALAADTLSGLSHLEGMAVAVGGDGYDLGDYVVAAGSIRLSAPAVLAHVGLRYNCDFESLDMTVIGGESVATRNKLIRAVGVLVQDTATIGVSATGFDRLEWKKSRDTSESMSAPAELRTEWFDMSVDGAWKKNPRIYLRHRGPYRARVLAIEPRVEFGT